MDLSLIIFLLVFLIIILVVLLFITIITIRRNKLPTDTLSIKLSDLDQKLFDLKSQTELTRNINQTVNDLSKIMINHKTRGNFGEFQLSHLISDICGTSSKIYSMQFTLNSGFIADCALKLPGSNKVLCIDSKFPLENFQKLSNENLPKEQAENYITPFKNDVKKHINDIAKKYIDTSQTANYAVMFIPSESIYAYILSRCDDIFQFALKSKVAIVSPTTFIGTVYTIIDLTKEYNRAANVDEIEKIIKDIYKDIETLNDRYAKLHNTLNSTIQKQLKDLNVTINKISKKAENAYNGFENKDDTKSEFEINNSYKNDTEDLSYLNELINKNL
ncbi:MAG: DNA recombination protein RmuC [Oscillospiraceae bacterium]